MKQDFCGRLLMPMFTRIAQALVAAALFLVAPQGAAQSFPVKPVQITVPFSTGNAIVDTVARLISPRLAEFLGQPVIINNRPGANGMIGAEQVARAAADGYTLLITSPSTQITAVFMNKQIPYDPQKDFTPISAVVEPVTGIAVLESFPANSVRELLDLARKNPGKFSFSSSGIGSVFHLTGELLNQAAGTDFLHVPYKVNQQALSDVLSGRITVLFNPILLISPQVRAGKLKLLAVLEGRRFAGLPGTASVIEVLPGFEKPPSWLGYFGPAALPPALVSRLNADIVRAVNAAEVKSKLEEGGMAVIGNSAQEFTEQIRNGFVVYGRAFKMAGVKPE